MVNRERISNRSTLKARHKGNSTDCNTGNEETLKSAAELNLGTLIMKKRVWSLTTHNITLLEILKKI